MSKEEPTKKTLYLNNIIMGDYESSGDVQKDLEICRDLLKAKGLYREITPTQAMFRQALSFATTAAYIHQRDLRTVPANGLSAAPFVVNSVFSIELYFKTLLNLVEGKQLRGHGLLDLFDALSEATHCELFNAAMHEAPKFQVELKSEDQFRGFIAELDTAFVDWRYCYEKGQAPLVNIPQTILVVNAAHAACKKLGAT